MGEQGLVAKARDGDDGALCVLLDQHEGAVRRRIERLLPPGLRRRMAVSDLLQETRIVALERRAHFDWRGPGSFRRWLIGIAENRTKQALEKHVAAEKRSLRREVTRGARPETRQFRGRNATPSQHAVGAEVAQMARDAMSVLPRDYREVLLLCRDQGLPLAQAAERMGRSYEATKKLYGRAIVRFTRVFKDMHEGRDG